MELTKESVNELFWKTAVEKHVLENGDIEFTPAVKGKSDGNVFVKAEEAVKYKEEIGELLQQVAVGRNLGCSIFKSELMHRYIKKEWTDSIDDVYKLMALGVCAGLVEVAGGGAFIYTRKKSENDEDEDETLYIL